MRKKNHYEILGVKRTVDDRGIKTAFRRLAKKYHPDLSGPGDTRRFQEILEAYTVLSDPQSRASYNEDLRTRDAQPAFQAKSELIRTSRNPTPVSSRRAPFFKSRSEQPGGFLSDDLFDYLFQDFPAWRIGSRWPERRKAMRVEVLLSREEAGQGGILPLSYPVRERCEGCRGSGYRGRLMCGSCHGRGMVEREEGVSVAIPAGVRDGAMIEVAIHDPENPHATLRVHVRVGIP